MTAAEHVMTISRNGQVSIPAATRARWGTRKVVVVDLGDRVVMRPAVDAQDALTMLQGKYADKGPDSGAARRAARRAEDSAPRRRG
ncbi:AbrB/MazE/SpoVT family DNA-binding domain-containing protein [Jatrophihabitans sp.]|uniref:AbrB/MazE/SpoVT family DNA-binding domain-containing protein n=1 Tax=Jatrophihabitans sp. TaxID=1932789 RepID=UPI002B8D5460|nr:AbrB/MazE/SpoVT family DNA-binding domain-containing protein [Jatrophihabitans sp.]